mmetsp:Transcript_52536/g.139437  ORF Transcript_52536/g.139437 Transcript_52536/m.139437 type:complete len:206 (+) Transcript_52536:1140-1757(+)
MPSGHPVLRCRHAQLLHGSDPLLPERREPRHGPGARGPRHFRGLRGGACRWHGLHRWGGAPRCGAAGGGCSRGRGGGAAGLPGAKCGCPCCSAEFVGGEACPAGKHRPEAIVRRRRNPHPDGYHHRSLAGVQVPGGAGMEHDGHAGGIQPQDRMGSGECAAGDDRSQYYVHCGPVRGSQRQDDRARGRRGDHRRRDLEPAQPPRG